VNRRKVRIDFSNIFRKMLFNKSGRHPSTSTVTASTATPLATSSTNNVKEAMVAFNNIEASNRLLRFLFITLEVLFLTRAYVLVFVKYLYLHLYLWSTLWSRHKYSYRYETPYLWFVISMIRYKYCTRYKYKISIC